MKDQFSEINEQFKKIEKEISSAEAISQPSRFKELSKEYGRLSEIVSKIKKLEKIEKYLFEAEQVEETEEDEDYKIFAREEAEKLRNKKEKLEKEIETDLNQEDQLIERSAIVEIRAGVGGNEAELWAKDLFEMYSKFFEQKGWKKKILSIQSTSLGGIKEVALEIIGKGVYGILKNESGVHRVQRIPQTEKKGRIHTSTATIVILPKAEEKDIQIKKEDLRIDVFCASGHGGQNVNKVATAVRITHLPTGIVCCCQNERSQRQNKEKALEILKSKLLAIEEEEKKEKEKGERKKQIKAAKRSEKIRTYNFPQHRITDHRTDRSFYNLSEVLEGKLEKIIQD